MRRARNAVSVMNGFIFSGRLSVSLSLSLSLSLSGGRHMRPHSLSALRQKLGQKQRNNETRFHSVQAASNPVLASKKKRQSSRGVNPKMARNPFKPTPEPLAGQKLDQTQWNSVTLGRTYLEAR